MVRGRAWTGFEAAALQEAMRKSVRDFASLLGIEATTVVNWRTGLGGVKLRSNTQGLLDTTLDQRATDWCTRNIDAFRTNQTARTP